MALTDAEKKRRSRAKKSVKYHDHERETSRKRMAIYRAKNKAQKRAMQLKSLLSAADKREIEGHVSRQKQHLLCDWFSYHNLKFDPKMIGDTKILNSFMTKVELHKIELQVAEFEISIIEDRDDGLNHDEYLHALAVHGGQSGKQGTAAASSKAEATKPLAFDVRPSQRTAAASVDKAEPARVGTAPKSAKAEPTPNQQRTFDLRQGQGQAPVTDALSLLLETAPLVTDVEEPSSDVSVEQVKEEPPRKLHTMDDFERELERKMPAITQGHRQHPSAHVDTMASIPNNLSQEAHDSMARRVQELEAMIGYPNPRDVAVPSQRQGVHDAPNGMSREGFHHHMSREDAHDIMSRLDPHDMAFARMAGLDPTAYVADVAQGNRSHAPNVAGAHVAHAAAPAGYNSAMTGFGQAAPPAAAAPVGYDPATAAGVSLEDPLLADMQGLEGGMDEVVQRFEGGLDEVLAAERDDMLLRMDLEGFDIDVNGLGIETECFGADAYTW